MQRLGIVILIVVGLMAGAVVLAQDEAPLTLGVVGILTDDTTTEQGLNAEAGMHLYAFNGQGDVRLAMDATRGKIDPILVVFAKDGSLLAVDDDGGDDLNAAVDLALPRQDTYFVLAGTPKTLYLPGKREELDGSYRLGSSGATTPTDDAGLDAAELGIQQITLDGSLAGALSDERPLFLAWLAVQDSIVVDLSADSTETDTLLYVFDAEGQRLALDDDSGSDGISAAISGLVLEEPGQYLVVVTTFGYHAAPERGITEGRFTLSATRSGGR